MFHLLTSVNGVGPKMGLAILSVHDVPQIARGIVEEDSRMFTRISGVGKKTAGRLLLELKEKVQPYVSALTALPGGAPVPEAGGAAPARVEDEVREALVALGFHAREVDQAVRDAVDVLGPEAATEALLKQALAQFRQR